MPCTIHFFMSYQKQDDETLNGANQTRASNKKNNLLLLSKVITFANYELNFCRRKINDQKS